MFVVSEWRRPRPLGDPRQGRGPAAGLPGRGGSRLRRSGQLRSGGLSTKQELRGALHGVNQGDDGIGCALRGKPSIKTKTFIMTTVCACHKCGSRILDPFHFSSLTQRHDQAKTRNAMGFLSLDTLVLRSLST